MTVPYATVALVGAGCGDPGLITVRGLEMVERADVIVHDRLVSQDLLALARGDARLIDVGKRSGNHPIPQEEIGELLLSEAESVGAGGLVVRLKGGDPFVFGRGAEEAELLAENGVPFCVVPGVTSAVAAPELAGIPVTRRGLASSFTVVAAHRRRGAALDMDFEALVRTGGTLVFLMGVATMDEVCARLVVAGASPETPVSVVERGSMPGQRVVSGTVGTIAALARSAMVASPAVLVVGDACRLAEKIGTGRLPLSGRRVLVTRPRGRSEALAARLRALGADVACAPCIETVPLPDDALATATARVAGCAWAVFTSAFGVRCLFRGLAAAGRDARGLAGTRIAAIGPATAAELERHGIIADIVPGVYDGGHLGEAVARAVAPGERAVLFRSAQGAPDLPGRLCAAGLAVEDVPLYDVVPARGAAPAEVAGDLAAGRFDAVAFMSALTVEAFAGRFPAVSPRAITAVCLGEQTTAAARAHGYRCVTAREATVTALVDAVLTMCCPQTAGREGGHASA